MNFHPSNGDGQPEGGPYENHPLVLAIKAQMDRGEIIRQSIWRSLRINLFIVLAISISVGLNLFLYLPTTLMMMRRLIMGY